METARDRIIGIMLGNVVIFVIFTTIWPVSAASIARHHLAAALEHLAALFRSREPQEERRSDFAEAMQDARAALVNEPLERHAMLEPAGRLPIDRTILAQVQALLLPILVVLDLRPQGPGAPEVIRYNMALSTWFQCAAAWIRDDRGPADVMAGLPRPPATSEPLHTWLCVLDQDIREIVTAASPALRPAPVSVPQKVRLVPD
jgi:multidrug resistance protein MdtO